MDIIPFKQLALSMYLQLTQFSIRFITKSVRKVFLYNVSLIFMTLNYFLKLLFETFTWVISYFRGFHILIKVIKHSWIFSLKLSFMFPIILIFYLLCRFKIFLFVEFKFLNLTLILVFIIIICSLFFNSFCLFSNRSQSMTQSFIVLVFWGKIHLLCFNKDSCTYFGC